MCTMSDIKFPVIKPQFIDGNKEIITPDGNGIATVNQFWQWAFSDLTGNTERGALAEYIVACALGVQNKLRVMWDTCDSLSPKE